VTLTLGAAELRRALQASLEVLRARRAAIDAANVYPVPDGDTGTNLVLTFEAVEAALQKAGDQLADVAKAVKTGSLMGARGNSGVIMAQILRGITEVLESGPAEPARLADGFKRAVELAYEAVLEPAEGTILTVARAASDAAAGQYASMPEQLDAVARAAGDALARTPEQLPLLAQAGVVDAGGMGLVAVLEAFAATIAGRELPASPEDAGDRVHPSELCDGTSSTHAFEVQYMLEASDEAVPALRQLLGTIGDSVAVVGGDGSWRVHVHTDQRDRATALGEAVGTVSQLEVVSFGEQLAASTANAQASHDAARAAGQRGIPLARAASAAALVVVAAGDGMKRMFADLGAIVVDGGATMNPSVGDLVEAIDGVPAASVLVLPNNDNVFAAAGVAKGESSKDVTVLRSRDMAEGLAAALAYGDARDPSANVADMQRALDQVRTGVVVLASRDAPVPGGDVTAGQPLGFAEGAIVSADASDAVAVASAVVETLVTPGDGLITVLCGADVDAAERSRLQRALAESFPAMTLEIHDGGQPVHRYLIAVE